MPPSNTQTEAFEVRHSGIVGPTHNWQERHSATSLRPSMEGRVSSPRQAALQGLEKAWALHEMGLKQGLSRLPNVHIFPRSGRWGSAGRILRS